MNRVVLFVLFIASAAMCSAQSWVSLMLDDSTNIHAVKEAFDDAWQDRPYEKGKGWKQFQRWYWFNDQRTWPDGERVDPGTRMEANEAVRTMRMQGVGARDEAVWESLGPTSWLSTSYNPGNGRVNTVVADPADTDLLYAGTPSSGLWRSTNGGSNWEALFTDLPSMGVSGIAIDTIGDGIIYIATGDGDGSDTYSAGVLKSLDNGATWVPTGLNWNISQSRTTRALRMNPNDPTNLYCASSNGLYRTVNSGDTWQQMNSGSFRDVEFMPGDTTLVFACTNQLFRSTANGSAFSMSGITGLPPESEVGRMAVAVTPADPMTVYVLCSSEFDNSFLGLYRSTDGGSMFELMSDSPNIFGYEDDGSDSGGQSWYDMALAVDPMDANTVYIGGVNVWKSENGGVDWQIISHWVFPSDVGYTHADIHSLDFIGSHLFCGSDGGLHRNENGLGNWTDLSAGLDIMQFYRLGGSELLPQLIMAGAQDNGSNRYQNGQWTHVFGADGMEAAVDPEDPQIVYCSSQNGGLRRSDDGGTEWIGIGDGIPDEGAWVTPFVLDPTWPGRIIAGYVNLWASDTRGDSWYQLTYWDDAQKVRCIAIAPSDGSVIYAARADRVEHSLDFGTTWSDIRPGLPNNAPTSIAVDDGDPLHLWISFSGTSANSKVFESMDGGLSWNNRTLNLPNTPINSVVVQPGSPNGLYVGTDLGVFYIDDYSPTWVPYGVGMPNVVVSELEINMSAGKLRAATFGRGIWEADLFLSPFANVHTLSQTEGPRLLALDGQGHYLIQARSGGKGITGVRVLDALRRIVDERRPAGASETIVDLADRSAGTYAVVIMTSEGAWCKRVVR
ncbi:MAG: hypothetical protein IPI81_09705 [Flavobacteriales bacterium]|nr:hypothetical protein [Flavobacteriales bacterium]